MKNSSSKNSISSSQSELPHSPLRPGASPPSEHGDPQRTPYHSPQESLDHPVDNSRALVPFEKPSQYSSAMTPSDRRKPPESVLPTVTVNRATREDPPPSVTKVGPAWSGDINNHGRSRTGTTPPGWSRRDDKLRKAALGFRFSEVVLCLISFSVMAADKTQGWSGDSFDRYKEYRYCLSVNVIAFTYAVFQAFDLAYQIATGKHVISYHHRYHFDFLMDQVLAYLLISASSAAATRVDDWQSNWGKDEFTEMASASVGMAFLAFIAFAFSSLISGYNLCTRSST